MDRLSQQMAQVPASSPASEGLSFEQVTLYTRDGFRLAAWWVPSLDEPAVRGLFAVLHHFHGGGKAAMLPWIKLLHTLGVAAVAIDGRGHGASAPLIPGQKDALVGRAEDVRAACLEARRRGASRLLLVGQSQGGGLPVLAVAAERADVAGVVVDSGPAWSLLAATVGLATFALAPLRPQRFALARVLLVPRLLRRAAPVRDSITLWTALLRLRSRPLLWIHGERDGIIPRLAAQRWFDLLRREPGPWRAISVPHGRHATCVQLGGSAVRNAVAIFVAQLVDPVRQPSTEPGR